MYQAIKNYCDDQQKKNGLFLIDMPTGFGKTHSVLDYIYEIATDDTRADQKVFFITTLKKNLPKDDLFKRFERAGQTVLFKEKFLFIDSNADSVIENLTKEVIHSIPESIRKTEEFKALDRDVKFIRSKSSDTDSNVKSIVARVKEDLRQRSEPQFRQYISRLICNQFTNIQARLQAIHTSQEWQWLGKLYPSVFTRDRQIIFMSIDKFLTRNSTIIEPSYMFYNSDIINDAIIFIDEFDATKETLLKNIIQNGLRDRIDYLELFRDIYAALQTKSFPTALTTPSQRRQDSDYKGKTLHSIIDGFKARAEEIHTAYCLQFSHRTSSEGIEANRNFIFQDHKYHSILDGNKNFVTTRCDNTAHINWIDFIEDKPAKDNNNIFVMLGQLRGFVTFFQRGISILALNYRELKREQKRPNEDEFTQEAAIRSVLAEFRLERKHIDYLTSEILMASRRKSNTLESPNYDLSFYEKGFRYYAFENDTAHDMQSQMMVCTFQTTPEKILLRFCDKAKVVGISATASVESVIGNYDIDYLKSKLGEHYHSVTATERASLNKQFETGSKGYKDISINVDFLSGSVNGNYSVESWKRVFSDEELAQHFFEKLEQRLPNDTKGYDKQRYVRIALAYKFFIQHNDVQSFLCLLTKHPKIGDATLALDFLLDIFDYIARENSTGLPACFSAKKSVVQLDGEEYDNKKDELIKRLSQGEKLFVISVYQTIGAGQNIQYPVPEGELAKLIQTNDFTHRGEKDFDAIYLEKPTHLIVKLDNNLSEEDFVKYLFQMEFLQQNAELSASDVLQHVKKAFQCYATQHISNAFAPNAYNKESVIKLSTRIIIQAIGRICRTNLKKPNIYVLADERLADDLDLGVADGRLLNPEFATLLEATKDRRTKDIETSSLESAASLTSVKVNTFITNLMREDWTEDRIQKWKDLRELVLRNPTLSEDEVKRNFIARNFYVRLPQKGSALFYKQEGDYSDIQVSFSQSKDFPYQVSSAAARLTELMSIEGVQKIFMERGWATNFIPNNYLLSPTLFNNIYKGALGEAVGSYLFQKYTGTKLKEIDDPAIFERFDFKVANAPIYVDFKHWKESDSFDAEQQRNHIFKKLRECSGKCAIIINILAEDDHPCHRTDDDLTILEVPYLYNGQPLTLNTNAINQIRRCLNEFTD